MYSRVNMTRLLSVMAVWVTLIGSASAAETFWGLTTDHTLVRFSSAAPGTILATLPITGLAGGEHLVGIEVEFPEGTFVGVSNVGRVYSINRLTGALTQLFPSQPVVTPAGSAFAVTDEWLSTLLVISDTGSGMAIFKHTGEQAALTGMPPSTHLVALAWHEIPGPGIGPTYRFGIDATTDTLYRVEQQSGRVSGVTAIGPLTVDTSEAAGMESGTYSEVLYATLTVAGVAGLYTIDPETGHATLAGALAAPITSLAADRQGYPQFARAQPYTWSGLVDEATTTVMYTIRRTGDDTVAKDYLVETVAEGATPGEDFIPYSQVLHFAAGEREKPLAVQIVDDAAWEPRENVRIRVTEQGPFGVIGEQLLQIVDDENQPPVLTLTSPAVLPFYATTPTITLAGTFSDDQPGVVVSYGRPYGPLGTATTSPWSFPDLPLAPGHNYFELYIEDAQHEIQLIGISVYRVAETDQTFVFAEGNTSGFFHTDLLFSNPNGGDVPVTIDFAREDGSVITHDLTLPALQRTTLNVASIPGLEATTMATVVRTSSFPIVVERTMRWGDSGYGASTEKAATSLSRTWYFAEGSQGFFSTFLLLVNPQQTANEVTVRFLREASTPVTKAYQMLPHQRLTIDAGSVPELVDTSFGMEVTFTDPGVAERAMYFGLARLWDAGHESAGAPAPATDWFLAEGATGPFFETFVLVANPSSTAADVTFTFLPEAGAPVTRVKQVPANGRLTVNIETEDPALASAGSVGTRVTSNVPVVVERSQYWPWGPDQWYEAHNSFGQTETAFHWGLAEGRVGGPDGYKTYILLANPHAIDTSYVTMSFFRENGRPPVSKRFVVPPSSRLTVDVGGAHVPEIADETFSVDITGPHIAVERAMYSNANGQFWAAGTNAAATKLP
jgi:hypothetical protein